MKSNSKNHELDGNKKVYQKSPHPFLLAIILTGILATLRYPNLTETAIAAVKVFQYPQQETKEKTTSKANKFANLLKSVTETQPDASTEIYPSFFLTNEYQILGVKPVPINENDRKKSNKRISEEQEKILNNIIEAVRQNLASQIGIAPEKIKLTEVTQESWPNTCLGLQKNDELCGLRLVEGWRLVFSNGQEKWIYRTDNFGKLMRMESKK